MFPGQAQASSWRELPPRRGGNGGWLFTVSFTEDFTAFPFIATVVHLQVLRTCSLDSQIFLQSPLSWFLICSLGLAILENVRIVFF